MLCSGADSSRLFIPSNKLCSTEDADLFDDTTITTASLPDDELFEYILIVIHNIAVITNDPVGITDRQVDSGRATFDYCARPLDSLRFAQRYRL